jgi:hypothetical protein
MFLNYHTEAKQESREVVLFYLNQLNKRKPRVLTLPAKEFIFEKMVLKSRPNAQIDCVERDELVYKEAKKNKPVKVSFEKGDIFDKLQSSTTPYDFVWLDLCGNLSSSTLVNLVSSSQARINGIFAFTVQATREKDIKHYIEIFNCKSYDDFRYRFIPDYISKHAKTVHPNFHLEKIHQYKSPGRSTAMCIYIFKTH